MKITVQHFDGKYPSFNISLHQVEGAEPFLVIKGCKIIEGQKGPFISYPSRKQDNGQYWNHVYGGEKFNEAVIKIAKGGQSTEQRRPPPPRQIQQAPQSPRGGSGFETMDDDIPW